MLAPWSIWARRCAAPAGGRQAREPLREALAIANDLGGAALAERAREELFASGARPRSEALKGRDSLTPSELRVALMAAEGLSNREVAQDLFVTVRTVESHLSRAYDKLEIRSRGELGRGRATDRGLSQGLSCGFSSARKATGKPGTRSRSSTLEYPFSSSR
jgi:DNA-binding CsgD family transcriptional regulator